MAHNDLVDYQTSFLSKNFERRPFLNFLEEFYRLPSGNMLPLTVKDCDVFQTIGSFCTMLHKNKKLNGCVLCIISTLNLGKSGYVSHLCLNDQIRGKGYAKVLYSEMINQALKLGIGMGYFIGHQNRFKHYYDIQSFYRIIDYQIMMKAGFHLNGRDDLEIKSSYMRQYKIEDGITADYQNWKKDADLYWDPDPAELKRYSDSGIFYTARDENGNLIGFFCLKPIDVVMKRTGIRLNMAMISYFHVVNDNLESVLLSLALRKSKDLKYHGLHGYISGHLTKDIVLDNKGFIPNNIFKLNFYGIDDIPIKEDISRVNVILF